MDGAYDAYVHCSVLLVENYRSKKYAREVMIGLVQFHLANNMLISMNLDVTIIMGTHPNNDSCRRLIDEATKHKLYEEYKYEIPERQYLRIGAKFKISSERNKSRQELAPFTDQQKSKIQNSPLPTNDRNKSRQELVPFTNQQKSKIQNSLPTNDRKRKKDDEDSVSKKPTNQQQTWSLQNPPRTGQHPAQMTHASTITSFNNCYQEFQLK